MPNYEFYPHSTHDDQRSRPLTSDEADYYTQHANDEWQAVMDANCAHDPELASYMYPIIQDSANMDRQTALEFKTLCYRVYFLTHTILLEDILDNPR